MCQKEEEVIVNRSERDINKRVMWTILDDECKARPAFRKRKMLNTDEIGK